MFLKTSGDTMLSASSRRWQQGCGAVGDGDDVYIYWKLVLAMQRGIGLSN